MAKLLKMTRRVQLPPGATGGRWRVVYHENLMTAWGISGGEYEGPLSGPDADGSGRAALLAEGTGPAQLHGADPGDALVLVTLTIFPSGGNKNFIPFEIVGHPRDTGAGEWDLSLYGALPGQVFMNPVQVGNLIDATKAARDAAAVAQGAAADLSTERGKIEALKSDLTTRAAGITAIKAINRPNATTDTGVGVAWGVTDRNGRSPLYVDTNGVVRAVRAIFASLTVVNFSASGTFSAQRLSADQVTANTLNLGSGNLRVVTNYGEVAWGVSDKFGRMPIYVSRDGITHIAKPDFSPTRGIAIWGDDLAEGMGDTGYGKNAPQGVASRVALSLSRPVVNLGIANQTTIDVAARFGALSRLATFSVTTAAPDGSVFTLTALDPDRSPLLSQWGRQQTGRLMGVPGTLTRGGEGQADVLTNRTGYYTFTPSAPTPNAFEVARGSVTWVPDNPYRNYTTVIFVGRNNIDRIGIDATQRELYGRDLEEHVQYIVDSLQGRHERYVVVGLLNSKTEVYGAGLEAIQGFNERLATSFGAHYLGLRRVLCRNADGTWRADGSPDPARMADNTHPNAQGYADIAAALTAFIQERGY
ncbi:hypothetical protein DAERI_060098 [Deinococcus aerius]|uniref:Uncharacterized protein n=1 Tax=Deinococcus aerius TaxID=200253 RepID=A0A2I9DHY6_9DEIO|nr:hypothetical protein [Deinococcus aerius]GBF05838.1 hypothetical protein DAERI_060098 [Deinococcus aerius]